MFSLIKRFLGVGLIIDGRPFVVFKLNQNFKPVLTVIVPKIISQIAHFFASLHRVIFSR